MLKEYSLSTNSFKRPKVFTGHQAAGLLLIRLILMEPGTDSLRPEMGIGLVSKYRYMNQDALIKLREDLANQITNYLPGLEANTIKFTYNPNKTLVIRIITNDTEYVFDTNQTNTPITIQDIANY